MADDRQLAMARAQFESFRAHLPNSLDEQVVSRFHEIVSLLEKATGEDLSNFRVPDDQMKQSIESIAPGGYRRRGHVNMSDEKYCDQKFMQMQLDGIVKYFQHLEAQRRPGAEGVDYWSMKDTELELLAKRYNIPPLSRAGRQLEHWYVDRDRIIGELLKHDKALREGKPEPPTNFNVINVGNMYGSSIQQGIDRSSVVIDYRSQAGELWSFLEEIKKSVDELKLSEAAKSQLYADTGTVEVQLASPNPKPSIIMESLHSLKTILENAAGSAAAAVLLPHIVKLLGGS